MKPQIFLLDGNALGHQHNMGTKLSVGGHPTQATFGMVRTLRNLRTKNPAAKIFLLWDGRAEWRFKLYPQYKFRRNQDPKALAMKEEYHKQRPDIERAMNLLGIDQVRSGRCEADDLAGTYSYVFAGKGWKTQLVTGDGDWLQLVNEHVEWFDPIRDKYVNHQNFTSQTGFRDPKQFLDNKCLMGDTSDCIKGVGGLGEKRAMELVTLYGRVPTFIKLYKEGKCENLPAYFVRFGENYKESQDNYWRNRKLMELRPGLPGVAERKTEKGAFDAAEFRKLAEDLAFWSVLKDFDNWIQPFEQRQQTQDAA
jgi:DNA polymerase-1